jgi:hypothetical protein
MHFTLFNVGIVEYRVNHFPLLRFDTFLTVAHSRLSAVFITSMGVAEALDDRNQTDDVSGFQEQSYFV